MLRQTKIWDQPLKDVRRTMESVKGEEVPKGIAHESTSLGGVDCETFLHLRDASRKTILYFHGGGFCLGIYASNRAFVAQLAVQTKMNVYMPNYRLAPEHPFPAGLDDAIAAYKAAIAMAPNGLIVVGDSSGCALAVAAMLALRDSGVKMPECIGCITPVFDLSGKGDTFRTRAKQDPFQMSDPLSIAKIYVNGQNPIMPTLSPIYGELRGLPPILIHAAEWDVFLSDSLRFAQKAEEAGVSVKLLRWPGMWHIFHMQYRIVPEARKALREFCAALTK
jgi:acetyl esterase/lipase